MLIDLSSPLGTICVLDIETALDPISLSILSTRPKDMPTALQRITAASLLWACQEDDGWTIEGIETRLATDHFSDEHEEAILELVDTAIGRIVRASGTLISFNGLAHDIPVLRRRAGRHLRFDLANLLTRQPRHIDLMLGSTRADRSQWASLAHTAVGLGLPVGPLSRDETLLSFAAQKCEADVVTTFLVALFEISMRTASERPLLLGWAALADRIEFMGARGQHLANFARHDLADAGRRYRGLGRGSEPE